MIDEKKLIEDITDVEVAWYLDGNYTTYDCTTIMEIIEEQPKVGEWIPCSQLLPLDGVNVLITDEYNNMSVGYLEIGMRRWHDIYDCIILDEIIAWQPLPEPYTLPEPYKGE